MSIRISITGNAGSHVSEVRPQIGKERHTFLRLMAIARCIETGVYDVSSLDGIPEALVKDAEEARAQRDTANAEKAKALHDCRMEVEKTRREAAIAVANSDQETIARMRLQIAELEDQNRLLIVQANIRGTRLPPQAIATANVQIPVATALDRALATQGSTVTTNPTVSGGRKPDHRRSGYEDVEID